MKTKWYDVSIAFYKSILVEIEDSGDEDANMEIATQVVDDEYHPDEIELQGEVDSNNLNTGFYDEVLGL